jgi:hypothetical protein
VYHITVQCSISPDRLPRNDNEKITYHKPLETAGNVCYYGAEIVEQVLTEERELGNIGFVDYRDD